MGPEVLWPQAQDPLFWLNKCMFSIKFPRHRAFNTKIDHTIWSNVKKHSIHEHFWLERASFHLSAIKIPTKSHLAMTSITWCDRETMANNKTTWCMVMTMGSMQAVSRMTLPETTEMNKLCHMAMDPTKHTKKASMISHSIMANSRLRAEQLQCRKVPKSRLVSTCKKADGKCEFELVWHTHTTKPMMDTETWQKVIVPSNHMYQGRTNEEIHVGFMKYIYIYDYICITK